MGIKRTGPPDNRYELPEDYREALFVPERAPGKEYNEFLSASHDIQHERARARALLQHAITTYANLSREIAFITMYSGGWMASEGEPDLKLEASLIQLTSIHFKLIC